MRIKKHITIVVIVALIFALTACQPTPEAPAVVEKNEEKLMEAIKGTPENNKATPENAEDNNIREFENSSGQYISEMEIPERWEGTFDTFNYNKIVAKANIQTGGLKKCPVMKVEKRSFTPEFAGKLVDYLTHDATGVRPGGMTKEILTQELIIAKRGVYNELTGKYESYDGQKEYIKDLEKRIAESPETPQYKPAGSEKIELPFEKNYQFEDGKTLELNITETTFLADPEIDAIVQLGAWVKDGGAYPGEADGTIIKVNVSEETAIKMGEQVLDDLGIEGLGLSYADTSRFLDGYETIWTGWMLHYARSNGGYIPIDPYEQGTPYAVEGVNKEFKPPWKAEALSLYLNENGLYSMYWQNPTETTEVVADDVKLVPIEDIKDLVVKTIKYEIAPANGARPTNYDISLNDMIIRDIVLSNTLYRVKDDFKAALSVPTWFVFFEPRFGYENPNNGAIPFMMTINAIDGTRMNPFSY